MVSFRICAINGASGVNAGKIEMTATIQADDGDEISVHTCHLYEEEMVVRLELSNESYEDSGEFDWISLTPDQARALGEALIAAADAIQPSARPALVKVCN
jgi:hypothetical protein